MPGGGSGRSVLQYVQFQPSPNRSVAVAWASRTLTYGPTVLSAIAHEMHEIWTTPGSA